MYITIICNYCNKHWEQYVYSTSSNKFKCSSCKETQSFTVSKKADQTVDYYIGCPEFPSKTDDSPNTAKMLDYANDSSELVSNAEDHEDY